MAQARLQRYHKVFHRIWASRDFRGFSEDGRHAALYLLTCSHRTTEGLFRLPVEFASYELQWDVDRTAAAFRELTDCGFIDWDQEIDLVWIVNALKLDPPVGPKRIQGVVNALAEVPDSRLRIGFRERIEHVSPELGRAIDEQLDWPGYPFDTVSACGQPPGETPSIPPPPPPPPPPPSPSPSSSSSSRARAGPVLHGRPGRHRRTPRR